MLILESDSENISQTNERLALENIIIHLFMQQEFPILITIQPSVNKFTYFNFD